MKKFSNLNKIQDAVANLFENLDGVDIHSEHVFTGIKDQNYNSENDGLLAISDGKLNIIPPKVGGNWPILVPSENIWITLNGKEIKAPIILKEIESIEIKPKNKQSKSNFYLHLSHDNTKVTLETEFIPGQTFYIKDAMAQHELELEALPNETIQPLPIKEEMVYKKLKQMGVTLDIDLYAVSTACSSLMNGQVVIVKGKEMIPPINGRIEYMFDNKERIYKSKDEDEQIDFFDKGDINSVEAGKMLAVVIAPIPGEPGLTVTGEIIVPPKEKHAKLYVGTGAKLVNDGQVAVATINGRPITRGNRKIISVIPELVIKSDVDLETGHINFRGDVKILGNVTEGFVVQATGSISIYGSVFHAKIFGENGVFIHNNLVGGLVFAGGEAAEYRSMLPLFVSLKQELIGIENAFSQLKENDSFSTHDLEVRGHGKLIKLIIEMRFPNIPKNLKKLFEMMPEDQRNKEGIWPVIELLYTKLSGLGPVTIRSIDEIIKYREFIGQVIEYIEEDMDTPANVRVNYCQNATIKASGSVAIGSSGTYHSKIHCGKEIDIKGFCRGGEVRAGTKVVAKEIGSVMSVATLASVSQGGKIIAGTIYTNVTLGVDGYERKNTELKHNVKISFKDKWIQEPI